MLQDFLLFPHKKIIRIEDTLLETGYCLMVRRNLINCGHAYLFIQNMHRFCEFQYDRSFKDYTMSNYQ